MAKLRIMNLYSVIMGMAFIFPLFQVNCSKLDTSSSHYTFAMLPRDSESDFHQKIVQGATIESKKRNISLNVIAPIDDRDYLFQQKELEKLFANKKIDGVILTPNHSKALQLTLAALDKNSIPFIIVDTPIDSVEGFEFNHYCGFVGTDNQLGGELAAEFIARELQKGNVLLIRGMETQQTSNDREIGFLTKIKQYPNIHVLKIVNGMWRQATVKKVLGKMSSYERSKINAVFAFNDLMALGAAEHFKNINHRPLIVGYDGLLEAQKAILNNSMDATIAQSPETMGKLAIEKLVDCIEKKSFSSENFLTHVTLIKPVKTLTSISSYE